MARDGIGRRLLAALAGSTPAFTPTEVKTDRQGAGRRLLAALAGSTPAFRSGEDSDEYTSQQTANVDAVDDPDLKPSGTDAGVRRAAVQELADPGPGIPTTFNEPAQQETAGNAPSGVSFATDEVRKDAVHRTILVVDVEMFGDRRWTRAHQVAVRAGLYRVLRQAFEQAGVSWDACDHEDRGDGVLVLAPADIPKAPFVDAVPHALVTALREYNTTHVAEERIRLRLALHAGEVNYDQHGVTAAAVNLAFRLLDAASLKDALANSQGVLAMITSDSFYDEVVRHSPVGVAGAYRRVHVNAKESAAMAWISLPEAEDASLTLDAKVVRQLDADRTSLRRINPVSSGHTTYVYLSQRGTYVLGTGRLTVGELWLNTPKEVYAVDVSPRALSFTLQLPSQEEAFSFAASVRATWQVVDPIAAVRGKVESPEQAVRHYLEERLRGLTRGFDVESSAAAERAINLDLGNRTVPISQAVAVTRCTVVLSLDDATRWHIASRTLATRERETLRQSEDTEAQAHQLALQHAAHQQQLERLKAEREPALKEQRMRVYAGESSGPVERMLVDYVERGEVLDMAGDEAVDEAAMRSWDDSRTIPASVIRDIVRGRLVTDPDPHGLRLRGARISGRLDLENITSAVGVELVDCLLEEGVAARDANLPGLALTGCRLEHPSEPAVDATGLVTIVLDLERTTATTDNTRGAVTLHGARLGHLDCTGASMHNESGPAISADCLRVDQAAYLSDGFEAVGAGEVGAVRFLGARVGALECDGATMRNDSGPALAADGMHVDRGAFFRRGFNAVGAGESGTVRLRTAHLGQLECDSASMRNDSGPALVADGMHVDQDVFLSGGFEAVGAGKGAAVSLAGVGVGGVLVFDPARLEHRTNPRARLKVDGLVYTGLPRGISTDGWLDLLGEGAPDYAAQPYQQLAAAHRAAGHDSQARRILMAQRRNQIHRRAITGRAERTWARFTGLTLGYGYQPWRALIGLLVVITSAVVLALLIGGHGGLAQIRNPPPPTPQACTVLERVGVGLDLGTPLITTGSRARCDTTSTPNGQILTITGWALRLLAWAFATLFIAGFTSAVRKT